MKCLFYFPFIHSFIYSFRSSRQTRDLIDNDQASEVSALYMVSQHEQQRKTKKNIVLNNFNSSSKPALRKKDTFTYPPSNAVPTDHEQTGHQRQRGKTFRVLKTESELEDTADDDGRSLRSNNYNNNKHGGIGAIAKHKKRRNLMSEHETSSVKDSEFGTSTRDDFEGRKRSASAGMIKDKVATRRQQQAKLLPKRNNMATTNSSYDKDQKPGWNSNFNSKRGNLLVLYTV